MAYVQRQTTHEGTLTTPEQARERRLNAEAAKSPKTRFKCAGCGERHSGYHAAPGPWPYCLSAACKSCCRHPLAKDDPTTFDNLDRHLMDQAQGQVSRLKQAGLL